MARRTACCTHLQTVTRDTSINPPWPTVPKLWPRSGPSAAPDGPGPPGACAPCPAGLPGWGGLNRGAGPGPPGPMLQTPGGLVGDRYGQVVTASPALHPALLDFRPWPIRSDPTLLSSAGWTEVCRPRCRSPPAQSQSVVMGSYDGDVAVGVRFDDDLPVRRCSAAGSGGARRLASPPSP